MDKGEEITVYGANWGGDTRRAKHFLNERNVAYTWVDIQQDDEGRAYVEKVNNGARSIPTIVFADGAILVEPSRTALAAKLNIS